MFFILIWKRWGILVPVIIALSWALAFWLRSVTGPATSGRGTLTFFGLGLIIAAASCFAFARYALPRMDPASPMYVWQEDHSPNQDGNTGPRYRQVPALDPTTGRQLVRQAQSTFFFIPLKYIPYPLGAFGLVAFVTGLITSS